MKKILKAAAFGAYLLPLVSFAAPPPPPPPGGGGTFALPAVNANNFTYGGFLGWISGFVTWFGNIVAVVGVMAIIYGAFLFVTATGEPSRVARAKTTILYGIIGLVVAALAFGANTIIGSFVG